MKGHKLVDLIMYEIVSNVYLFEVPCDRQLSRTLPRALLLLVRIFELESCTVTPSNHFLNPLSFFTHDEPDNVSGNVHFCVNSSRECVHPRLESISSGWWRSSCHRISCVFHL